MRTPQEINRQRAESVANIIGGLTEIQQFLEKNGFITGYSEGILTGAKMPNLQPAVLSVALKAFFHGISKLLVNCFYSFLGFVHGALGFAQSDNIVKAGCFLKSVVYFSKCFILESVNKTGPVTFYKLESVFAELTKPACRAITLDDYAIVFLYERYSVWVCIFGFRIYSKGCGGHLRLLFRIYCGNNASLNKLSGNSNRFSAKNLTILAAMGYTSNVAAKSATGFRSPNRRRIHRPLSFFGGFFVSVAWLTFGRVLQGAFGLAVPTFGLLTCLIRPFSFRSETGGKFSLNVGVTP